MRIAKTLFFVVLAASPAFARTVNITLLVTTDMHGNLFPYDFYTAKPANRGLVKIATLIREARAENPHAVLIDCGDTIQGAPLESVYQHYVRYGKLPLGLALEAPLPADPMMRAMNALKYDAMVVGNHEYNFGLKNLNKARSEAEFPWLSANTHVVAGSTAKPFAPYILKEVDGVRIAIIGITTPNIPAWEEADHYKGYRFIGGKEAVVATMAELQAKHHPDVVIVAAHAGLGHDLTTGPAESGEAKGENMVYDIATSVPGIDAVVFGHTHGQLAGQRLPNGVLLMQPKNWAISLGRMDFTVDDGGGHWKVMNKSSRLLPVTESTAVDESLAAIGKPYFDAAERYLSAPVAKSSQDLSSSLARVRDTALIDAIQEVQLHYAKADVSFTSAFNVGVRVPKGPVSVRQIAALYLYDNTLFAVEGNGRMVREALENAAKYYLPCSGDCSTGPLINTRLPGYNFDMAEGVAYQIDVSKPVGQRIVNLTWKGKPLADDQPLRLAVNNYRAGGSGGYEMFRAAKIVWRSNDEIRDMMIEYYTQKKALPADADHNWKVIPETAERELEREAATQSRTRSTQ